MNFGFTEEQDLLRREVRKFLDGQCPMEDVRRLAATPEGHSSQLWKQVAELGWLGLTLPESAGGAGLSWVDLVVVLEETGRSLFPAPLVSNTLAAGAILDEGSDAQRERWLPALADGSRIGTVALTEESDVWTASGIALRAERDGDGWALRGSKQLVPDVAQADLYVVGFRTGEAEDDLALAVVDSEADGLSAECFTTMDATKRMGTLRLDGVRIEADRVLGDAGETDKAGEAGKARRAIDRILDRGAVAVTAELIGAAEACHALTVQYAKDRIQFGSPIGRFQGVKHPLAEMHLQIESSKSLLYAAAYAVDNDPEELPRSASLAKAYASDAFVRVGIDCIQLHGAYGYTQDCDVQLYFKRSKWARAMFGDPDHHYERVAAIRGV